MEAVLEDMTEITDNLVLSFSLQGNINRYLLGEQPIAQIFFDIFEELAPNLDENLFVTLITTNNKSKTIYVYTFTVN